MKLQGIILMSLLIYPAFSKPIEFTKRKIVNNAFISTMICLLTPTGHNNYFLLGFSRSRKNTALFIINLFTSDRKCLSLV